MTQSTEHQSKEADWKLYALSLIQCVGVACAIVLLVLSRYACEIGFFSYIFVTLTILLGISVLVFMSTPPQRKNTEEAFETVLGGHNQDNLASQATDAKRRTYRDRKKILRHAIHLFAILDLLVICYLIVNTGGSERSFYAPFLFVITPLLILFRCLSRWTVVTYALVAVAIFSIGLCPPFREHVSPAAETFRRFDEMYYAVLLILSTLACTLFPVMFAVMERKYLHDAEAGQATDCANVAT